MLKINMKSAANLVKGQGVGSCYDEQVALMKSSDDFLVSENGRGKYDIIHYHTVNPGYYLDRLMRKKSTVGIGYVHFLPNTLDESLRLPILFRKVFYKYLLKFYSSMDYLVTVNPYFVEEIRGYGINAPKVVCIPNFVDSEKFYPVSPDEVRKGRESLGLDLDKFIVLGVGQLQTRKGIVDFVETAKRLPDVQFIWAGGFSFGKITDGYDIIRKMVKNPPDNIKFLGIVDRKEMPLVYSIADMMFLPSYDELFPMSILEALCCKKPVMVRDIPLYDDILFDYCLRGSNAEQFAQIVSRLAGSADECMQWQNRSWQCHILYTKESAMRQWTTFYHTAYCQFMSGRAGNAIGGKDIELKGIPQESINHGSDINRDVLHMSKKIRTVRVDRINK